MLDPRSFLSRADCWVPQFGTAHSEAPLQRITEEGEKSMKLQ